MLEIMFDLTPDIIYKGSGVIEALPKNSFELRPIYEDYPLTLVTTLIQSLLKT